MARKEGYQRCHAWARRSKRIEGQTVLRVDKALGGEGICTFVLANGTSFCLCATDLGFWVEDTANADGFFPSLTSLLTEYDHYTRMYHMSGMFDRPKAEIAVIDDVLEVAAPDKSFFIKMANLTDWELKIVSDPKGLVILEEAALMGDCWKSFFGKPDDDVPEELRLT